MNEAPDSVARIYEEPIFRQLVAREVSRASRYRDFFALCLIASGPDTRHNVPPQELTSSIAALLRSTDTVGRLHDSVGVLLVNTAPTEALAIAERVRLRLTAAAASDESSNRIKLSVGLACFPGDGTTPEELFESATGFMAKSERDAGNRVTGAGDGT